MPTLLIHIQNEDPVVGDVDALPAATDTLLLVKNPRRKDGKDLFFLDANVTSVIWPISRINFIEVIPGVEEEDIITFVRE
ncbi:MAG: hypothetical protein HGA53_00235 [Anaerolineaceae bacterium]|nr:hypothetical protein [Anaerolineaceae bacterium]